MKIFRWHDWNLDKIAKHGVSREEAERVVRNAARPFARRRDNDKWLVIGRGQGDRFVEVIYVLDDDDTIFIILPCRSRRGEDDKEPV